MRCLDHAPDGGTGTHYRYLDSREMPEEFPAAPEAAMGPVEHCPLPEDRDGQVGGQGMA